jgi:hypothetical protein
VEHAELKTIFEDRERSGKHVVAVVVDAAVDLERLRYQAMAGFGLDYLRVELGADVCI